MVEFERNLRCTVEKAEIAKQTVSRNWISKMLPMRAQKKVKKVWLETGGKGIMLCSGRSLVKLYPAIM